MHVPTAKGGKHYILAMTNFKTWKLDKQKCEHTTAYMNVWQAKWGFGLILWNVKVAKIKALQLSVCCV